MGTNEKKNTPWNQKANQVHRASFASEISQNVSVLIHFLHAKHGLGGWGIDGLYQPTEERAPWLSVCSQEVLIAQLRWWTSILGLDINERLLKLSRKTVGPLEGSKLLCEDLDTREQDTSRLPGNPNISTGSS